MMRRLVGGLALALLLAGCASQPASRSKPSTTPSAQPASTESTSTKPALADLVLSADALGDIHIGNPVPRTTPLAKYDATACEFTAMGTPPGSSSTAAWVANYPKQTNATGQTAPFIIVTAKQKPHAPVSTLWVWAPGIHTAKGIQVGSSRSQLEAAYPRPDALEHGRVSDVYVVDGVVGTLLIEVARSDGNDVGYWGPADVDTVLWMGAIAPGGTAVPIAGTDGGPSTCADIKS
ncbi:MAG TPA: hypothetical protein VIJ11_13515 [Galbitalea sp.]